MLGKGCAGEEDGKTCDVVRCSAVMWISKSGFQEDLYVQYQCDLATDQTKFVGRIDTGIQECGLRTVKKDVQGAHSAVGVSTRYVTRIATSSGGERKW